MKTTRLISFLILPIIWCTIFSIPSTVIGGSQNSGPTYTPLAVGPILGVEEGDSISPVEVMRNIYSISIGLGSILAVVMIVWGGMKYTVSEAVGSKQDAIDTIQGAVWGLVLLIGSYLILRTINADLVNISLDLGGGNAISGPVEAVPNPNQNQGGQTRYCFVYPNGQVSAAYNTIDACNAQRLQSNGSVCSVC